MYIRGSVLFVASSLCMLLVIPVRAQVPERAALLRLNRDLLESIYLRQDTSLLAATARPDLLVIPPGGIVENRSQLINGFRNTVMDSVRIDDEQVIGNATAAVVIARVTRLGSDPNGYVPGRTRVMNVFIFEVGRWRLLARSVTPCIERAVAAGRC